MCNSDCHALVERITYRVRSWTSKMLTFAGRLQLIDSVLNHIVGYRLQVLILPEKVLKKVESICCAFLWNGSAKYVSGAKVSW